MALFSHLRKLMGLVLAVVIIATGVLPVRAQLSYGEGQGNWLSNAPLTVDPSGLLDAALYISEESEGQLSRKGPSHRLGTGDPPAIVAEIPAAVLIPVPHYVPAYRAPPGDSGVFLSPLKTGPPSI